MIKLAFQRIGRSKRTKIVVSVGEGISFTTDADLSNVEEREKAAARICARFPGADCDTVADELEQEAAKLDPVQGGAGQSDQLVSLAKEQYRFGASMSGESFASVKGGPNIAIPFKGSGNALRSALACEYFRRHGRVPNASALADALTVLEGEARECSRETLHLRIAHHGDGIVLDLGRQDGLAVVVDPKGWTVTPSPVLFQRTTLTSELPVPEQGGTVVDLQGLLNVDPDSWRLLVGWIIAALIPEMPHPVLLLGGEHGTGKSTAARMIVGVFDASPAPLRSQPRDPDQWATAACASLCVVTDNVSGIPVWWSDALCKAVTGDGWVKRALYTDSETVVLSFRRVLILTSIDAGALRGDLGDRVLIVDFERIAGEARRSEKELEREFRRLHARILGAFLDLLAPVLRELPSVSLTSHPRMADFACVLAAVDIVTGFDSLPIYLRQAGRVANDVLEGDPVGVALLEYLRTHAEFNGTASDLLDALKPDPLPQDWPKRPNLLSGRIKRLAPSLRERGFEVSDSRAPDEGRRRQWTIRKLPAERTSTGDASEVPESRPDDLDGPDDASAGPSGTGAIE